MKIKFEFIVLGVIAPCFVLSSAIAQTSLPATSITASSESKLSNILETNSKKFQFGMKSIQQKSDLNSANTLNTYIRLEFDKSLSKNLSLDFMGKLNLESGSSDSLFENNSYEPSSGLSLGRAELNYSLLKNINLTAGAMGLESYNNSLLLAKTSFNGMGQKFSFKSDNYEINLSALQAIPTTKNSSNRLDAVDEGNPSFFLENLNLKLGNELAQIEANISHYAFDNLSNSVAGASHYYGNSVDLDSFESGEFVYSYIGWTYGLRGKISLNSFAFSPYYEAVLNNSAPEDNKAYKAGVAFIKSVKDSEYELGFENFEIQSDAVVSFYASEAYRSNRAGSAINAKYTGLQSNINIEVNIAQFREIEINQLEDRDEEQVIFIGASKAYEL